MKVFCSFHLGETVETAFHAHLVSLGDAGEAGVGFPVLFVAFGCKR